MGIKVLKKLQKVMLLKSRLRVFSKSDDEEEVESATASITPAGCVPLHVGMKERRRFVVEAHYLNHPLLAHLLEISAAHFGYSHDGILRIACDIHLFEHALNLIRSRNPCAHLLQVQQLSHVMQTALKHLD
eukprot:Gb_04142 [translate_table: standard]